MGNFRIVIEGVGNHGMDREPKQGEVVNFYKQGAATPDAIAKFCSDAMKYMAGAQVNSATLTHWPGDECEVVDNLITGNRDKGNF